MPTDHLVRGPWELGIGWQAPRAVHNAASLHSSDGCACQAIPLFPMARAPSDLYAYTIRSNIRLSLKINISLIIGETYKMVEDFST